MPIQRKTITVTQQQDSWIKVQVKTGNYGNDSEYIRDLIRKDIENKEKLDTLRYALIAGEKSGISKRNMKDILKDAKKRHANTDAVQTVKNPNIEGLVHYIIVAVNPSQPIIRQVPLGQENSYKTLADAKYAARELIQQTIENAKTSLADIRQIGIAKIKYLKL